MQGSGLRRGFRVSEKRRAPFVRILVVVNLKSGGSDAGLYDFARLLGSEGAEVTMRFAGPNAPIEKLVEDASSFDRVVAAGGDGTVSAVCHATSGCGVPVLVYPAGTANLLALNLGLPLDAPALADALLNGSPVAFDLGELQHPLPQGGYERTGFTIAAGAGYDAAIMESAVPMKATFGAAAYLLAAMGNIAPTHSEFELVLDGEHVTTDGMAVLLVNFGRIQFDLALTHSWDPRDGLFDVAVIRTRNVAELIPSVLAAMADRIGEYPSRGPIDVYQAATVEVSAYPPLRIQSDGDSLDALTPFAACVLPGAATLIVPPKSPFAG
ncbi:MAG: diacylglycerol kinase [Actinobacteria bacterium]|nr:MAG: diacylglycerol kinase [Actinomycetota bacterium]